MAIIVGPTTLLRVFNHRYSIDIPPFLGNPTKGQPQQGPTELHCLVWPEIGLERPEHPLQGTNWWRCCLDLDTGGMGWSGWGTSEKDTVVARQLLPSNLVEWNIHTGKWKVVGFMVNIPVLATSIP